MLYSAPIAISTAPQRSRFRTATPPARANGRHIPQQQGRAADGQSVEQVYAAPLVHVLEGLDGAGDEEHQQEWDQDGGDLRSQVVGHRVAELFGQVFLGDVLHQLSGLLK